MEYEWDEDKDLENERKHGLSLSAGIAVFDDRFRLEQYDDRAHPEDRYITIGMDTRTKLLYVCYTMVKGNVTRLISVRYAEPPERRLYESQFLW